jgi:hypothetical protein
MKKIYFVLVALLFAGLATSTFAAPPDSGRPGQQDPEKQPRFHKSGPRLNLTQEQREKMKGLMKDFIDDTHDRDLNCIAQSYFDTRQAHLLIITVTLKNVLLNPSSRPLQLLSNRPEGSRPSSPSEPYSTG